MSSEETAAVYPWRDDPSYLDSLPTDATSGGKKFGDENKADFINVDVEVNVLAYPYTSQRLRALTEVVEVHPDGRDYIAAREHGLSLGYNLFTPNPPPPPPQAKPAKKTAQPWIVDLATLTSVPLPSGKHHKDHSEEYRAKRSAAERALLLHDPTASLTSESASMDDALLKLEEMNSRLMAKKSAVSSGVDQLSSRPRGAGATETERAEQQRLAAGCQEECDDVRQLIASHDMEQLAATKQVEAYDAKWHTTLAAGENARRAALVHMARSARSLYSEMEEVQLRLTDHVLVGSAEEAERMSKAAGSEGDKLRELRASICRLEKKQEAQKVVLIAVAKRSMEARERHAKQMAGHASTLGAASSLRESLIDEEASLQALLCEATNKLPPPRSTSISRPPILGAHIAFDPDQHPQLHGDPHPNLHKQQGLRSQRSSSSNFLTSPEGQEPRTLGTTLARADPAYSDDDGGGMSPDGTPYLVVRQPTSKLGAKSWHVVRRSIQLHQADGSARGFGLTLARDDSMPTLLLTARVVKALSAQGGSSVREDGSSVRGASSIIGDPSIGVKATKLTTPSQKIKKGEKMLQLSRSLVVTGVDADGAAAGFDVKVNDVLVEIDGLPLTDGSELRRVQPGQLVEILIARPSFTSKRSTSLFSRISSYYSVFSKRNSKRK